MFITLAVIPSLLDVRQFDPRLMPERRRSKAWSGELPSLFLASHQCDPSLFGWICIAARCESLQDELDLSDDRFCFGLRAPNGHDREVQRSIEAPPFLQIRDRLGD